MGSRRTQATMITATATPRSKARTLRLRSYRAYIRTIIKAVNTLEYTKHLVLLPSPPTWGYDLNNGNKILDVRLKAMTSGDYDFSLVVHLCHHDNCMTDTYPAELRKQNPQTMTWRKWRLTVSLLAAVEYQRFWNTIGTCPNNVRYRLMKKITADNVSRCEFQKRSTSRENVRKYS